LSSELTTRLTGQYLKIELYPFSFVEFLKLHKVDWQKNDSKHLADTLKYFDRFICKGCAEFSVDNDSEILQRIYEDILYKGLLIRFGIREVKSFCGSVEC
jgi:predicted AAA+ superfamily ATPase